jgi:serine/threonine protein kinase
LRYKRDFTDELYGKSIRIIEDDVRNLDGQDVKPLPEENDDDYEEEDDPELPTELDRLPVINANDTHFLKRPRLGSEVRNLLKTHGSTQIVQLLGKDAISSHLVFPKHSQIFGHDFATTPLLKRSLLQIIDGLESLHSKDIIHRDLVWRNLLVGDQHQIILCDIESALSSAPCRPPELWVDNPVYTPAADVFGLGNLMWDLTYSNQVRLLSFHYAFPVPPPFDEVYFACLNPNPAERPTLAQVRSILEAIE